MSFDSVEISERPIAGTIGIITPVVAVDNAVPHVVDLARRERVREVR